MPTESGFQNQKKKGSSQFKTIQPVGSDKYGVNTAQMYLYDITPSAIPLVSVAVDPDDKDKLYLEITAHGANEKDIVRLLDGALKGWEFDIIEIVDANILAVHNISDVNGVSVLPSVGDQAKTCRWITAKADSEGALTTSSGPEQFVRNGATATVTQDTAVPANNRPLPAGLYIVKDGVVYPVTKDTGTPSNTLAIPVEIVQASGSPITFTAGDINIQISHLGANFDSTRIGDGTNLVAITAAGEMKVLDSQVLAQLVTLTAKDFSTSAKQDLAKAVLDNILTAIGVTNAKDFSTSAKQDLAKAVLDNILTAIGVTNAKDFSTSAKQDLAKAVLDNILTGQGALTEAAPASDTASSGLNGRLQRIAQRLTSLIALFPTTIGQKANAASLGVSLSTEQDAKLDNIVTGVAARIIDSIGQSQTATSATIGAPAGAKGFTIQNSTRAAGALRFTKTGGGASASIGFLLEPGQSTSYQEGASGIDVFAVDALAIDAAIIWYK